MAYLVADKILRSTKIKFEVAQSELRLLLKSNIMHFEKHSCEYLRCTYDHSAIKVNLFIYSAIYLFTLYAGERREIINEIYISKVD